MIEFAQLIFSLFFENSSKRFRHRQFNGAARKRIEKYENSTEPAKREAQQNYGEFWAHVRPAHKISYVIFGALVSPKGKW